MNLFNYYKYYTWPNKIKLLNKINNIIDKKSTFDDEDLKADATKTSSVKFIEYHYLKNLLEEYIVNALSVNSDIFGYTIFPISPYQVLNINYYKNNEQYNWHTDASRNPSKDIKLTLLLNISNNKYSGGEFEIFLSEKPEQIKTFTKSGDILLLKSSVLHRVKPVLKGIRKGLTIFLTGPRFI